MPVPPEVAYGGFQCHRLHSRANWKMSDIVFRCIKCRKRLVVDDSGAELTLPCPSCGKTITIPPKPLWLPAINEALRKILQEQVTGKIGDGRARAKLRDAIVAAGYHPERAHVEIDSPDDLLSYERLNLVLKTNQDIALGFGRMVQSNDVDTIDDWPAWELVRVEDRDHPRGDSTYPAGSPGGIGWEDRWAAAARAAGDDDALRVFNETGRMVALIDSEIWDHLGNDWADSLGNAFAPFAWGSGMDVEEVDRSQAESLGLIHPGDKVQPQSVDRPPKSIPIEDERIAEYLWNLPKLCDHCGKDKASRLVYSCDACGESICRECIAEGYKCSGPEPPPEPRDAIQCCSRAIREMMGRELPLEREVAERVLQFCDRAFEFGFAAHHRDIEAHAHRMRGEAFESLGQKERALQEYELAAEKDPQVGVKRRIASLRKERPEL